MSTQLRALLDRFRHDRVVVMSGAGTPSVCKLAQPNEARHTLAELENFSASGFS